MFVFPTIVGVIPFEDFSFRIFPTNVGASSISPASPQVGMFFILLGVRD